MQEQWNLRDYYLKAARFDAVGHNDVADGWSWSSGQGC